MVKKLLRFEVSSEVLKKLLFYGRKTYNAMVFYNAKHLTLISPAIVDIYLEPWKNNDSCFLIVEDKSFPKVEPGKEIPIGTIEFWG